MWNAIALLGTLVVVSSEVSFLPVVIAGSTIGVLMLFSDHFCASSLRLPEVDNREW